MSKNAVAYVPEEEALGRGRLSSNNSESCHRGSTICTIVMVANTLKDDRILLF